MFNSLARMREADVKKDGDAAITAQRYRRAFLLLRRLAREAEPTCFRRVRRLTYDQISGNGPDVGAAREL
jgi:hypothetical protein